MNPLHTLRAFTPRRCAAAVAVAAAALGTPLVASADTHMDTYRSERADCMAGRTTQSRALCLYDARLALEAARQGRLEVATEDERARNALARCDAVPEEGRASCLRIARGEGEREGSVAQGVVVMWLAEADSAATEVSAADGESTQVSSAPDGEAAE